MAFLTLNALTIPCHGKQGSEQRKNLGDVARAIDGTLRESRLATKRSWELRTVLQTQEAGLAIAGLIQGDGYHWTWDADLYSDGKGLINSAGTTSGAGTASGKFGNMLRIGNTEQITYPVVLPSKYTIMFWEHDGVSTWEHFVFNSDGDKWKDGVTHAPAIVSVTVSGTDVLVGDAATQYDLDDLVVLPYLVPDAWVETGGAWASPSAAFSNLPVLTGDGDLFDNVSTNVKGSIKRITPTGFSNAGTWEKSGLVIDFTLMEV